MAEFTGERLIPGQVEPDLWNEHLARYRFAAEFVQGRRVLDAGCGAGYGAAELARKAQRVIALDLSAEAVRDGKQRYWEPNIDFLAASCDRLPVRNGSVDVVLSFEVIEHLEDWKGFLAEIQRVLAPGGTLLLSTPNKEYYAEARRESGPNVYHVHEFDWEEFSAEVEARFAPVAWYVQNHAAGVVLAGLKGQPLAGMPALHVQSKETDAREGNFFLAVCGGAAYQGPETFFLLPSTANVLRERETHIRKLEGELATKDEWLEREKAEKQDVLNLFQKQTADLERSNRWALDLEAQLEAKGKELIECIGHLGTAEQTVIERTQWALALHQQVQELEAQLALVRASRWYRLGRKLDLGPQLPEKA